MGTSARSALLWGGGFTLVRDMVQFATMLALVRLLTPADYGTAALAQTIVGLVSVVSVATFLLHALQLRDPEQISWQIHFTAGAVINSLLFVFTLATALVLSFTERYHHLALPLAGVGTVLIVEIAATLRYRMLETQHDWRRLRLLSLMGTVLGASAGIVIGLLGGGVWALVVQVPIFGLPSAIDLFWGGRWRPNWTWHWPAYRESAIFGINRIGAAALVRGRQTVEQTVFVASYDFAALGVFGRSVGLATLMAGRIGAIATSSLYPVITRAEQCSPQFRRAAGLVLRGVSWATIPTAAFLGLCADDLVALLYGPTWSEVIPLMPLVAAWVGMAGISAALSNLLVANQNLRASLLIELAASVTAIALAIVLLPLGIELYVSSLIGQGLLLLVVSMATLIKFGAIDGREANLAFLPPIVSATGAALALMGVRGLDGFSEGVFALVGARLVLETLIYFISYVVLLRLAFSAALIEILLVAPGGRQLRRFLLLDSIAPESP